MSKYRPLPVIPIIGVHGQFGAGKDTCIADRLVSRWGYTRIRFGDSLKEEVADAVVTGSVPACATSLIREILASFRDQASAVWEKPTHPAMRHLLQWWGTEYRRAEDPDYWVKSFIFKAGRVESGKVTAPDVRFLNEVGAIRSQGGQVWHIERPSNDVASLYAFREKQHRSETELSAFPFDMNWVNDSTIEAIWERLDCFMETGQAPLFG